jgi:hypothetical protein
MIDLLYECIIALAEHFLGHTTDMTMISYTSFNFMSISCIQNYYCSSFFFFVFKLLNLFWSFLTRALFSMPSGTTKKLPLS